jgi:streptogramin lyase
MRSGALLYGLLLFLLICPLYSFAESLVGPYFYGLKVPLVSESTPPSMPGGIARDSSGNLYIVDKGNRQILKLQPNGTSSVLNISNMSLSSPTGIAVDRNNNIYVADTGSNHIVKLTLTDATNASVSVLNTGAFTLSQPEAVAVDRQGIVYIANTGSETGGIVRVAPGDTRLIGHFNHPHALAVNPEGDVYVAQNDYTHPVWEIDHEYLQPNSLDFYSSTVTHLAVDGAGNLM